MVWLNHEHQNTPGPPNGFGGSMCECPKCQKKRILANSIDHIKLLVQLDEAEDKLITLSNLFDSPYKKKKLLEAVTMLADWAKNMEVAV